MNNLVGKLNKTVLFSLLLVGTISVSFGSDRLSSVTDSRQNAITRAIEEVGPAVASINITQIRQYRPSPFFNDPFFEFWFPEDFFKHKVKSLGSGIVISPDGYIITNEHVIEGADEIIVTLPGGLEYISEVIGMDKETDIAVLKIEDKNLPYAEFGDSDDIIIGEWAIALGNPFGLFDVSKQPTATIGIVSATGLDFGKEYSGRIYQEMIQTDAAINKGNSGGPLVNSIGEVVGINTFIFTGGNVSEGSIGIGFAIPINRARTIAEELKKYGKIDRSFTTGLSVQTVDRFLADYLELPDAQGVVVTEVKHESSAENAGIEIGDVIVWVNNEIINSRNDIMKIIEESYLRAGDELKIKYYRDGKYRTTNIRLVNK